MFGRPDYRTVHSIRMLSKQSSILKNQSERRKNVKICVIDDAPFTPLRNLQNHGFNISEIGDIKTIAEVSEYSIALCDLMGVGTHFDATKQGASILSEIKLNYPNVFVVAYTGAKLGTRVTNDARDLADAMIKKDADIEQWKALLDPYVERAIDPFEIWMKFRIHLVSQSIDTMLLLKLEDAYVRSVQKGDKEFSLLKNILDSESQAAQWKNVVLSMITTSAIKVIVSSL